MAVTYRMLLPVEQRKRGEQDKSARLIALSSLGCLLGHIEHWDVQLESIAVSKVDGVISISLSGKIPAEQAAHVGIELSSEQEF